ncbi:unnamed protein product [Acanthoscelides obtectus]|uniref:Uncharacterized protein n=1 Tax=Acanthoscelides obtectus TaxID=200917 RepID=A0A9P0ME83_ACAOB|nr:unnamed protein product [Acanthoscelides obtectus]CAK1630963.1 hypothetical protein AOBTE_LOCUS6674 [Acanthoscelides obtectus]
MQRAYLSLKFIYGSRKFLSLKLKIMLCDTLVLSLFNYADVLYGPHLTNLYRRKVQLVQNSCLRLAFGIQRRHRISHKLKDAGWLNMENRRLLHSAVFYHKEILVRTPQYLYQKITYRTDVHNINVRSKGLIPNI